uniref:Uncharacterized protein n=1 Tax=Leersia perrieri TaxID=77586 RepID=A0A0D9W047_9ORYZ
MATAASSNIPMIMSAMAASTTPLRSPRGATAAAASALRSRLCRSTPPARRVGVWCSGTTPPSSSPAEVPGPGGGEMEELPSIGTPPEFEPPPGLDVPVPTPEPRPEQPGPSIPSPPVPEIPNVPRNPDVPPPQPELDPPKAPPEIVPEPPPPDVEPPSFLV